MNETADTETELFIPEGYIDGCTAFPDEIMGENIRSCCVEHDMAYLKAETLDEKWKADQELMSCVDQHIDSPMGDIVSIIMWIGTATVGTVLWLTKKWRFKKPEVKK